MRFVGVDLAGSPRNATGFCVLTVDGERKTVSARLLYSDSDIIGAIKSTGDVKCVAIDAPLKYEGVNRKCDLELSGYGALPVTMKGMEVLAERGSGLSETLAAAGCRLIEVYSNASSKILGLHDPQDVKMQKNLIAAGIDGDVLKRLLSRDELDAVIAALTAYLDAEGATLEIGDEGGKVTVPRV